MERKDNQSVKDFLVGVVAEETQLPEKTCDRVVMWAYKQAKDATSEYSSVELSGFGTLLVSQHKLNKEIARGEKKLESPKDEELAEYWTKQIEYLKTKLRG